MRIVRIYQPGVYQVGQILELSPAAGHHVAVVLRMQVGESFNLFCGDNRELIATIQAVKKNCVSVMIDSEEFNNRESILNIHLAQAISKGERMEWVMQKASELGVRSITPILSTRCVVKLDSARLDKKIQQWQAIAIAACEQCGRNQVPVIHPAVTLSHYLEQSQAQLKLILDPGGQNNWRAYLPGPTEIALLIGPEGGFTPEEIKIAQAEDFQTLTLGPRILRTETAAITALSVLQAVGGDL